MPGKKKTKSKKGKKVSLNIETKPGERILISKKGEVKKYTPPKPKRERADPALVKAEDAIMSAFVEKVRDARQSQDMSPETLAKNLSERYNLSISGNYLRMMERRSSPISLIHMLACADYFGILHDIRVEKFS